MIKLVDLLKLSGVNLGTYKIHCATPSSKGGDPMAAFFDGTFQGWQSWQSKQNFRVSQIVSLIQRAGTKWLFAGVWDRLGQPTHSIEPYPHFEYNTREVPGLDDLTGRVVVSFKPRGRARYLKGSRYGHELLVDHILPARLSLREFPGFQSVLVSHADLRRIVREGVASWRVALQSVGGIYLIYDKSCGRHYVGSAYGAGGIWGRWCAYAATSHGGNIELTAVVKDKGPTHAEHFQYSILEIINPMALATDVIQREDHWKQVLGSRTHGYNSN